MATYFGWDEELAGGQKDKFGKFKPGVTRVRFLTAPVVYDKTWDGVSKRAYSAFLFDFELKTARIYDVPVSVLAQIKANFAEHKVAPEGRDAYGYSVTRTGSGKEDTKYTVVESKKFMPIPEEFTDAKLAELRQELLDLRNGSSNEKTSVVLEPKPLASTAALDF